VNRDSAAYSYKGKIVSNHHIHLNHIELNGIEKADDLILAGWTRVFSHPVKHSRNQLGLEFTFTKRIGIPWA